MRTAEIHALVHAHRSRALPVAFLHILRQPALEPDDHAFLLEHIHDLPVIDLFRWLARCEEGFTGPLIRQLAERATRDCTAFKHEILDAPLLRLDALEWAELADLLRGKIPEEVLQIIVSRGRDDASPRKGPAAPAKAGGSAPRAAAPVDVSPAELMITKAVRNGSCMPAEAPLPVGDAIEATLGSLGTLGRIGRAMRGARERGEASVEALSTSIEAELSDLSMDQIIDAVHVCFLPFPADLLAAVALKRARSSDEDWSRVAARLPDYLGEAVAEKARRTTRGAELAMLLEWLEIHGSPRKMVVDIAVESLRTVDASSPLLMWLARQLTTRSAWEKYGADVLGALVAEGAFAELAELFTLAWSEGMNVPILVLREPREAVADGPRGFIEAIHAAFAKALIQMAAEALRGADERRAMAALSALVCLDPPSRMSRLVHDLRRDVGERGELAELVAVNERLVKHSSAREASFEGVVAAVHALADALGSA